MFLSSFFTGLTGRNSVRHARHQACNIFGTNLCCGMARFNTIRGQKAYSGV